MQTINKFLIKGNNKMKPYKPKTLTTQQVSQNKILQSLIEDILILTINHPTIKNVGMLKTLIY